MKEISQKNLLIIVNNLNMNKRKFFIKKTDTLEEVNVMKILSGYFQYGFQNPLDIGVFSVTVFLNGTTLIPVCDEKGITIVRTEHAGKYLTDLTEDEQQEFLCQ